MEFVHAHMRAKTKETDRCVCEGCVCNRPISVILLQFSGSLGGC